MNERFYVYVYEDDCGDVYYVGKGTGYRATAKHRVPRPTDKSRIRIIKAGIDNKTALAIERFYIKAYRPFGKLLNMTQGGQSGCSPRRRPDVVYLRGKQYMNRGLKANTRWNRRWLIEEEAIVQQAYAPLNSNHLVWENGLGDLYQ